MSQQYNYVCDQNKNKITVGFDCCCPTMHTFSVCDSSITNGLKKPYLIQFSETGEFGYVESGETKSFANQSEAEADIYHFFFMLYSTLKTVD